MYKIIIADNYARDNVSERHLVGLLSKESADTICALLNKEHEGSNDYYRVVPNDQKLYTWEP